MFNSHTLCTQKGFQDCNTKLAKATTRMSITLEKMSVTGLAVCCCKNQCNIKKKDSFEVLLGQDLYDLKFYYQNLKYNY